MGTELCADLLEYLEEHGYLDTVRYAKSIKQEHIKIIGAVNSLNITDDVIKVEPRSTQVWSLTEEGKEVIERGSHEVEMWNAVPLNGAPLSKILPKIPNRLGGNKIGFNKGMSLGWLKVEEVNGEHVVKRRVREVKDTVKEDMFLILNNQSFKLDRENKLEYKRRKLICDTIITSYIVSRGRKFTTALKRVENDVTAEMLATGSWKKCIFKPYNYNSMGTPPNGGHLHPLLKVRTEVRQIFLEMGFTEMPTNNYVESSFWNFDALFQPQEHPAREAHDTFFLSEPATSSTFPSEYLERVRRMHCHGGHGSRGYGSGWKLEEAGKNLLRTHTTAVSARMLYKLAQEGFRPSKYFSIDRVFRNEELDATHLAEFQQVEGVIADYNLTLGNLIGMLSQFFRKLGMEQLHFKPAYNPYTEPSMEIFSYHAGLKKWIEVGNSGVFRPEMLLPMGLPKDVNVIAWGLSLERPTMIKYELDNIRDLVGPKVDLQMVEDNPICRLDKGRTSLDDLIRVMEQRWDSIHSELQILQSEIEEESSRQH